MNQENSDWLRKSKELVSKLNVDPTTTSIIPPDGTQIKQKEREHSGIHGKFADTSGREYYRILQGPPKDQMLLARILKGVLPVSDVVYVSDMPEQIDTEGHLYLSYKMPLEDIGPSQAKYGPEEIQQDIDLLRLIFSDRDHSLYERNRPGSEHNNLRSKDGRTAFFDFGVAFQNPEAYGSWAYGDESESHHQSLRAAMIERRKTPIELKNIPFLRERVEALHKHLAGEYGNTFIRAIVADMERRGIGTPQVILAAPGKSVDERISAFQKEIEKRIEALRAGLNDPIEIYKPG